MPMSTEIDECADAALNNCHENASCSDTDGSYTCGCNTGFTGDGVTCAGSLLCLLIFDFNLN